MGTRDSPVATPRLKREDCERTKHDSAFSPWKILVGASDWEDHSSGKEGAEKYRTQNLPQIASPGLYELGITDSCMNAGRNLDARFIVVVYLGQADCVRTRLQQYGRSGAHLGKSSLSVSSNNCKGSSSDKQSGTRLFEDMLSRGCNIVFRWAPMTSKAHAERTEFSLLKAFDYAWNKGANGYRRPDDVLKKLSEVASKTHHLLSIARRLLQFNPKKVGINIKGDPPFDEKDHGLSNREGLFKGIIKFSRSHPTAVYGRSSENGDNDTICGIALGSGMICRNPPVKGRKRCPEHKGKKISTRHKPTVPRERKYDAEELYSSFHELKSSALSTYSPASNSLSLICGVILNDGSSCMKPPVRGRKGCSEHKGMRLRNVTDFALKVVAPPNHLAYENDGFGKSVKSLSWLNKAKNNEGTTCGVDHGDGTFCLKKPARGRVRCEDHKGMRVNRVKKNASCGKCKDDCFPNR